MSAQTEIYRIAFDLLDVLEEDNEEGADWDRIDPLAARLRRALDDAHAGDAIALEERALEQDSIDAHLEAEFEDRVSGAES